MELQAGQVQVHDGEKQLLYKTTGTCCQYIEVAVKDSKLTKCCFYGGCNGNTQGVAKLAKGMKADEVITRLGGISCNGKPTSCPDQLARALRKMIGK